MFVVTLSAYPPKKHGSEKQVLPFTEQLFVIFNCFVQDIAFVCTYPNSSTSQTNNSVATASVDGFITVWDTTLSLTQIHSFSLWTQLSQPSTPSLLSNIAILPFALPIKTTATVSVPTTPTIGTPTTLPDKKEKWAKWVSAEIQVEQTDQGLYPGINFL